MQNESRFGYGETTKNAGRFVLNTLNTRNDMTYKSTVHVPEQMIGAGRTRVLLSHDDMQPSALSSAQQQVDNYLREDNRGEDDIVRLNDSIIENNYGENEDTERTNNSMNIK